MGIVDGSIHWNGQDNFVDFIQFAAAKVGMTREEYISHYGRGIDEADKKPGPDPYHRGLEDDEVEDKEDQIKKQAEMDDDDPDAYKEMPGDKEAREKGEVKTSKATKAYNKIYGEDLDEGTMSDIHQMAGEAKSKEDFLKKFFKEYGAKIKKTKDSEEWASSMYDEMDESKVEETQKMTKKEWGHIKKFNKHVTASGEKFVMNYDDRIGTFLEPVEIVDETVTPENPVHEAKAYKLKASEFGADTHSAAYNVKGETTWRVHSTYAIDQVSGENDASERDVVFFEAMPINNDIYIKIGGINNLKRTGSTVGDNFGTTIEEWKKDPKGIAKEASEFLTDATHLKWINKKARSQGQTIKWALKDDYSSVIVDLVNKSLGLTESQVNEFYFENDEEERLQKFVDQLSFGDELEYRDGFSTGRGSFPNTRELKKELDSNFQLLLTQKSGRNWDLYVGSDDLVFLIQPDLGAKNYMQISISSTKEQWNDESSVFARSNGYSVYESIVAEGMSKSAIKKAIKTIDKQIDTETGGDGEALDNETLQALEQERERLQAMNESKDRMIKQIERTLKDGDSIFKLPMATQKYYNKNKSDFESVVTEGKTITKASIEEVGDSRNREGYSSNEYYILADFVDGEITMKDLAKLVKSREVQKELKGESEIDMEYLEEFSESVVNEEKIKYAKGKTYQSSGHWTVMVDSNSSMCDIRVNQSAGWRLDPHDDREETWELLDNGRQRATIYFKSGNIDKFAKQMFDLNDRTTWGNKTKLTAKDYADIIRVWIDMRKANETVVVKSGFVKTLNEYFGNYEYDRFIKQYGKIKYPKYIGVKIKELVAGGFVEKMYGKESNYMSFWLNQMGDRKFDTAARKKELGEIGYKLSDLHWNDLTGYTAFVFVGAEAAYEVSKHIQDRIANKEEIEPAYYMMKEYFNSFGMSINRSKIFNIAVEKLEKWMKDNAIETL